MQVQMSRDDCSRNAKRYQPLRSIRGFNDLPESDLDALSPRLQWQRIEAGQPLTFQQDTGHEIYLIVQGAVKSLMYTESGKEITYEENHAGSFVGEVSAIDGMPGQAQLVAIKDSVVARMDYEEFASLMSRNPRLSAEVARKMCESIRTLCDRVYELSAMPVARRIDLELYRLAASHSEDGVSAILDEMPRHVEIANRVNTQRESVTKHFTRLRKHGVIIKKKGKVVIPDIELLRQSSYESSGLN